MLSSRLPVYLRRMARRFLTHQYTWIDNDSIPVLDINDDPTYDDLGLQIMSDADAIPEKPCLFLYDEVVSNSVAGPVTLRVPTLYVLHDDPISVNDVVSNVLDRDRQTVLLKSALVESIDTTAEVGNAAIKVLRLSGAST